MTDARRGTRPLFRFAMLGVPAAKRTKLAQLNLYGRVLLVLLRGIISTFAIFAREQNVDAHLLLHDFGDDTGADGTAALTDGEAKTPTQIGRASCRERV